MSIWDQSWRFISFMGIQYALGRRGSYPYGLLVNLSLFQIFLLVILCDALQTITLLLFFDRLPGIRQLLEKKQNRLKEKNSRRWPQYISKYRYSAMVFISAIPYGGGSLSGSFLALSTGSPKFKSFLLILSGCVLGTLVYHAVFSQFS